jgi:hypothetical protein
VSESVTSPKPSLGGFGKKERCCGLAAAFGGVCLEWYGSY